MSPFNESQLASTAFDQSTSSKIYSLFLGLDEIKNTPFSFSTSVMLTRDNLSGDLYCRGTETSPHPCSFGLPTGAQGYEQGEKKGRGLLFNLRYKLLKDQRGQLGLAYLTTTPDYNLNDVDSESATNFHQTKGKGYHFYFTVQFKKGLLYRVGYRKQKLRGTRGTSSGKYTDGSTAEFDSYYMTVKLNF